MYTRQNMEQKPRYNEGQLWRVGFHLDFIHAIECLSGLIEIHEVLWMPKDDALVFLITNKDKSGTLFDGAKGLRAMPIDSVEVSKFSGQSLMVSRPNDGRDFPCGGN